MRNCNLLGAVRKRDRIATLIRGVLEIREQRISITAAMPNETKATRWPRPRTVEFMSVTPFPDVCKGDRLGELIDEAIDAAGLSLCDSDILVVTHKIVSVAEGQIVSLEDTTISRRADDLARSTGKDPRVVEWILREARTLVRVAKNHIITEHRLGHISANAGVDRSNVGGEECLCLLPEDPDRSARMIAESLRMRRSVSIGVFVSDSHGRPFRVGTTGTCIGSYGVPTLIDLRGEPDRFGRILTNSLEAVGDEICAAANVLMGQGAESVPVVIVRGIATASNGSSTTDLLRSPEDDIFRCLSTGVR